MAMTSELSGVPGRRVDLAVLPATVIPKGKFLYVVSCTFCTLYNHL
jgi:hypothetical protein